MLPTISLWGWFLSVRGSVVECRFLIPLMILLIMSYLIMEITGITDMSMSMLTHLNNRFKLSETRQFWLQSLSTGMFLTLDLLFEYWIEHVTIGHL